MMRSILALLVLLTPVATLADTAPWRVTVEGGAVYQQISDVEIPPGSGTRFSLVDAVGSGPLPYVRFETRYAFHSKHRIRLLIAPLVIEEEGQLPFDVDYDGETFAADTDTVYRYQFNSYRLGYAYRFYENISWSWDVGFTAKIRQAEIALSQGDTKSGYPNLGFVPLLHLSGEYRINPNWQVQTDLDALASPYGRAIDLGLFVHYQFQNGWQVGGGYRTVEGGADVDRVYNFAWLHYAGLRLQANL